MIALLIFGALLGTFTTTQLQYDACKKQDFKTDACNFTRELEERFGSGNSQNG